MQKGKMKVLLYLKKSGLDKSGQAPIMGRITYNRTMAQFSSKLSCLPKLWNVRESRLNGKSHEAVATNAKLEQLLLSVQRAYQTLCDRGIEFSAKEIKEQFQGSMQNRTTFLQRYDQMCGRREAIGWCGDYGTLALDVLHAPKASASLYTRAIPYRRHHLWATNRGFLGRLASIQRGETWSFTELLPQDGFGGQESMPFGFS